MTKQDFLDALKDHPRAPDAIFWFCQAWHSGDDDLYKIMCALDFTPKPWSDNPTIKAPDGALILNPNYDPILVGLLLRLSTVFNPVVEPAFERVKMADVREGQVLTSDGGFPCITPKWPSRVFTHHGALGVQCSGGLHNVKLLPGSESTFHPLQEDPEGYVIGFVR